MCAGSLVLVFAITPADTTLISVGMNGWAAAGSSEQVSLSADGRKVAFTSTAGNLIANDINGQRDVFVLDRGTGAMQRASVSSSGQAANSAAIFPKLAAGGGQVVFQSFASNLVAGDGNGLEDIFLHELQGGLTTCISVSPGGQPGTGGPTGPFFPYEPAAAISGDGRHVVFVSAFTNLVPTDTNAAPDVFIRDRVLNQTHRISVSATGAQANGASRWPAMSRDGRWVAFQSFASNLVPGDTNGKGDIFLYDTVKGRIERVSLADSGSQANDHCERPTTSEDGQLIAFQSFASNLVSADTNGQSDIFVRDLRTRRTVRVTRGLGGLQSDGNSHAPELSSNGRYLSYWSLATNHVSGDANNRADVFRADLSTGQILRVSLSAVDAEVVDNSISPAMSADARFIAFESSGLFAGNDYNSSSDVLLRDMASGFPATACAGTLDSAACIPSLHFSGTAVLSQPARLNIEARPVRNQRIGCLLYSLRGAWQPFRGAMLCVDAPIGRTPLQSSGGSPPQLNDCSGSLRFEFKQWLASGIDPALVPGAVVHCQYWYRDTLPGIGPVERFSDAGYFELLP